MHPFAIDREYRRTELLEFLGSRQGQTGVMWGNKVPGCVICTTGGRHGSHSGYADGRNTDGTWTYFAQGRSGNQDRSTAANRRLLDRGNSILLFTTREPLRREVLSTGSHQKLYSFAGVFHLLVDDDFIPDEGPRKGDLLVRLTLVAASDEAIQPSPARTRLANLTQLARIRSGLAAAPEGGQDPRTRLATYRKRSDQIREYALARAGGVCEGCGEPGPFVDASGIKFLEVHHVNRLADDGPDAPQNVVAVCPNCHKRAHFAADRSAFKVTLDENVAAAELRVTAEGQHPTQTAVEAEPATLNDQGGTLGP